VRILAFSDTHAKHERLPKPPDHDLAIFAGDCGGEKLYRYVEFLEWYSKLTDKPKVMIYGNHEKWPEEDPQEAAMLAEEAGISVLLDSQVTIQGVTIWGSPYTPEFMGWAWMEDFHDWEQIPQEVDVIVTHGPPWGILDRNVQGENCGDRRLARVLKKRSFQAHIFGHIHEERASWGRYHNVCCVDERYKVYEEPWKVITINE
jgi:Icc-related predicted phosphoesterase